MQSQCQTLQKPDIQALTDADRGTASRLKQRYSYPSLGARKPTAQCTLVDPLTYVRWFVAQVRALYTVSMTMR